MIGHVERAVLRKRCLKWSIQGMIVTWSKLKNFHRACIRFYRLYNYLRLPLCKTWVTERKNLNVGEKKQILKSG